MKQCKRILSALLAVIMLLTPCAMAAPSGLEHFEARNAFTVDKFNDVSETDWFYNNVKSVYELGLMVGRADDFFDTESYVTIAEAITIAARLHSIYYTGKDAFEPSTPWYDTYAAYALANGIVQEPAADYAKIATRAEFAAILKNALPGEALVSINIVMDNAIPDVKTTDAGGDAIYTLYRAGVMIGNDGEGTFYPDSAIKRCEVAAIVTRMACPLLRLSIRLTTASGVVSDKNESENGSDNTPEEPEEEPEQEPEEEPVQQLTREDLQAYVVETAWAYYMKETGVQYDSNPITAVYDKNYGAYRNTEGQAPEYATSDTTHYSVCSYFAYDTYYNTFVDDAGVGYRLGLGDCAADARTRYLWDSISPEDSVYALRWATEGFEETDTVVVGVPEEIKTSEQFAEWLSANWEEVLEPGDMMVALGKDSGHATMYIGNGMMLECTGNKYNTATGADGTESLGGILVNSFVQYYLTPGGNSYLGTVYDQNIIFYVLRPINHMVDENDVYDPECGYSLRPAAISRKEYAGIEIDRTVDVSPYGTAVQNDTLTYSITITNNSNSERANVTSVTGEGVAVNYLNWCREFYGLDGFGGMAYEDLPVTELIPEGTTLVDGSVTGGGVVKDGAILWTLDLNAGESVTLRYSVRVEADLGDVIVSGSGSVADIPSNTLSNRVGGTKLTADPIGLENFTNYAEQYTSSFRENGLVDTVYSSVFGLKFEFPDEISTIVDQLFEKKAVVSDDQGSTTNMYVLKEHNTNDIYRAMLVDRFIAGYKVHTHPLENGRILDFNIDYFEAGDILVKVSSVSENAYTTIVYLGDGQFACLDNDGYAAASSSGSLYRDLLRSNYECVFLLRPSQAYADVTAALPSAGEDIVTPDPTLENSSTVHTPEDPGTEDEWRRAIVETAYAFYRRTDHAVYSADALTALGSAGPLQSTWNVSPEYISETSPYYGVENYLIYEIYQNAVNVQLANDQNGMLDIDALTAAYGVENTAAQPADLVVLSDGKLALCLEEGKYLTMQDQESAIVILQNAAVTAVLQPLGMLEPHLTAAGAARIQYPGLDVSITSDIGGVGSAYNTAEQGREVTYTITVSNNGSAKYEGFEIVQFVPRKGTYSDLAANHTEPETVTYSYISGNGRLSWTADLNCGETITVQYTITVNECLGGSDYLYYLTTSGKVGAENTYLPMKSLTNRIGYNKPNEAQLESMLELTTENAGEYGISTWNGAKYTSIAGVRSFYSTYLGVTGLNSSSSIPGINEIIGIKRSRKSTISLVDDPELFYSGYGIWTAPDSDGGYPYGNQLTVEGFYGGERIYADQADNSMILNPSLDYLEPGDYIMLFYVERDGTAYPACFWLYLGKTNAGIYKLMQLDTTVNENPVVYEYLDPTGFFENYVTAYNKDADPSSRIAAFAVARPSQVANIAPAEEIAPEAGLLDVTITNSSGRFASVKTGDTVTYTVTVTNNSDADMDSVTTVLTLTGGEVTEGRLNYTGAIPAGESVTHTIQAKVTAAVTEHVVLSVDAAAEEISGSAVTSNGVAYSLSENQLDYLFNEVSKSSYEMKKIAGIRAVYTAMGAQKATGAQVASGSTFLPKDGNIAVFKTDSDGNYVFCTVDDYANAEQYADYRTFENMMILYGGSKHVKSDHRAYMDAADFSFDMLEPGDYITIGAGTTYYLYLGHNETTGQHVFKCATDSATVLKYAGTEASFVNSDAESFIVARPSQGYDMSDGSSETPQEPQEPQEGDVEISVSNGLVYGGTVQNGDEITFTVTVKNSTANEMTNLCVTETVTNGQIVAVGETACEASESYAWNMAALPAGGTETMVFKVKVTGTYGQTVALSGAAGNCSDMSEIRIGSALSDAQLAALAAVTDETVSSLKGTKSAANFLRTVYTDVLNTSSSGVVGYSNFLDSYFEGEQGAYTVKSDLSGLSGDAATNWNMLVYYGGDYFASVQNGKYVNGDTFNLDFLQPGDYVMGYVRKTSATSDQNTYHGVYLGKDSQGNHRFAHYQSSSVAAYTSADFASLMGSWRHAYIMRPALSYDLAPVA